MKWKARTQAGVCNQYDWISHAADWRGQADLIAVFQNGIQGRLLSVDENQFHVLLVYGLLDQQSVSPFDLGSSCRYINPSQ